MFGLFCFSGLYVLVETFNWYFSSQIRCLKGIEFEVEKMEEEGWDKEGSGRTRLHTPKNETLYYLEYLYIRGTVLRPVAFVSSRSL